MPLSITLLLFGVESNSWNPLTSSSNLIISYDVPNFSQHVYSEKLESPSLIAQLWKSANFRLSGFFCIVWVVRPYLLGLMCSTVYVSWATLIIGPSKFFQLQKYFEQKSDNLRKLWTWLAVWYPDKYCFDDVWEYTKATIFQVFWQ